MKRLTSILAVAIASAALVASAALAGNGKGHQTLTATCTTSTSSVTVHASSGQSAWINGTHWVVLKFSGTYTPAGGTAQTFSKTYGHKTGLMKRTVQSCSGSQTDTAGDTFSFTATVAKTGK
jgi:hypothetical protein